MSEQKRAGVALWRQIADRLRDELSGYAANDGGRLPSEVSLSGRFDVNRHTIRAALAALADEGLVVSERGHGTFVRARPRITYPLSSRTRFSTALEAQNASGYHQMLRHETVAADNTVAGMLGLTTGHSVLKIDTRGLADGQPITFATHWFDAERLGEMPDHLTRLSSITAALKACGIDDYVRRSTVLQARHATDEETRHLDIGHNAIVLVSRAINDDLQGRAIQFSESRFAADRVEITVPGS